MFNPNQLPTPDLGLHCPDCGYPLAHLSERRCPECGRAFEMDQMIPPGDFPMLVADGQPVKATEEVVALLRAYQIPYIEQVDTVGGVFPPVHGSKGPARPVEVPRECYLEVVDLLRRQQLDEPMPSPPPATNGTDPWKCPRCGEENPANFELCWHCETPFGDEPPVD